MTAMLAEARAGAFDLLLAGYSDRWQRNLRRTLELLEDHLHPAGVALVMCDRRILSSDPHDWDELVAEAARRSATAAASQSGSAMATLPSSNNTMTKADCRRWVSADLRSHPTRWRSTRARSTWPWRSSSGMRSAR